MSPLIEVRHHWPRVILRKCLPEGGLWDDSIAHSALAFPVAWRLIENPSVALRARVAGSVDQLVYSRKNLSYLA